MKFRKSYKYRKYRKYSSLKKIPEAKKTKKRRKAPIKISFRPRRRTQRHIVLSVIFIIGLIVLILLAKAASSLFSVRIDIKDIEAFKIPPNEIIYIYEISTEQGKDPHTALTAYCIDNRFFKEKRTAYTKEQIQANFFPKMEKIKSSVPEKRFNVYYNIIDTVLSEIKVFPIDTKESYMFGDTWLAKTDCEGRHHKGADIFDRENIRGRLSVMSMTGGIVEDKGKSKSGGWYVGIRSDKGAYFLYDHLDTLENIETGSPVAAGSILGYMGSSGKGRPANVHLGIKLNTELKKGGMWINPYPFLRLAEIESEGMY